MNRSLLVLPMALILALPAEAFWTDKLTKADKTFSKEGFSLENVLSEWQIYDECKNSIQEKSV